MSEKAASRKSEIETELAQWERFALNRLNRDLKPEQARPFAVTALPDELAFEVSRGRSDVRAGDREACEVGVCRHAHGGWD